MYTRVRALACRTIVALVKNTNWPRVAIVPLPPHKSSYPHAFTFAPMKQERESANVPTSLAPTPAQKLICSIMGNTHPHSCTMRPPTTLRPAPVRPPVDITSQLSLIIASSKVCLSVSVCCADEIQAHAEALQEKHEALKAAYKALEREHEAIKQENKNIKEEHDAIKREHKAIKGEHEAMKAEFIPMKAAHKALGLEHEAIKGEHDAIKVEHGAIKGQYEAMKAEFIAMKTEAAVAGAQTLNMRIDDVAIVLSHRLLCHHLGMAAGTGDQGEALWAMCARLQPAGLRAALLALAETDLAKPTPEQVMMLRQFL